MTSEVTIAAAISMDMRQAALVADSGAMQLAGMDLREQWTSDASAAAQLTLRRNEQNLTALAKAAAAADSLAQEAISALLALQQAGK